MNGHANIDASDMFSEQVVDFLGFVAQSGLMLTRWKAKCVNVFKTIWIIFPEAMYFTVIERRVINRKGRPCDLERACAIAATVSLEHEADVDEMIDIDEWPSMEKIIQPKTWNTTSGDLPDSIDVKLQLSIFAILE
ncbi:hypothetical protein N7G274_005483 [Stereocaulon virgatum]|uniref:Uncharacterized protein n=1 Tax=Stereocaulon virgatum TaxID=373712 RepID=A0ABR4A717_9LECA